MTKSLRYAVKTTPAIIKKVIHMGSQSQDLHANTQEATDAAISALTATVPNLTHIAIGTYLDYGASASLSGDIYSILFPNEYVGTYLDYGSGSSTSSSSTATGDPFFVVNPDERVGTYLDYGSAGGGAASTIASNDQFTKWASSIHAAGKKMIIRSAGFNDWLGANGATQYTGADFAANHRTKMVQWIQNNWAIFASGDIFEPVPDEAENNSLWNTTYGNITSGAGLVAFNDFILGAIADATATFATLGVTGVEVNHVTNTPIIAKDVISSYTATRLFAMSTDDFPEQVTDTTATLCNTALQNELTASIATSHQSKPKEVTIGPNTRVQLSDSVQASALALELATVNTTLSGTLTGVTVSQFGATTNAPTSRLFDWNGSTWVPRSAATTANNFFASVSGAGIRKGLTYEVRKANSVTKTLKYEVKTTSSAITKSLKYTVRRTASSITKSLGYVIAPVVIKTKSLRYAVVSPVVVTKSLKYTIRSSSPMTKSLRYAIRKTPAITKSERYAVRVATTVTKSLQYVIQRLITKSLKYEVKRSVAKTKSLMYVVPHASTVTKSLKYDVRAVHTAITKSLRYTVTFVPGALTKSLQYYVAPALTVTKALKYTVPHAYTKTLSAKYTTRIVATAKTKTLRYQVQKSSMRTLSLRYTVRPIASVTKSLQYTIKANKLVAKSLSYRIRTIHSLTKPLKYAVKITSGLAITKGLKYTIKPAPLAITKTMRYRVRTQLVITKDLSYQIMVHPTITKSLKYTIRSSPTVVKTLRYEINPHPPGMTLSLRYAVVPRKVITKSLGYAVLAKISKKKNFARFKEVRTIMRSKGK